MNIGFFGASQISKEILEELNSKLNTDKYRIKGIITNPDSVVGRKKELKENNVKIFAKTHNINCLDSFETEKVISFLRDNDISLCIVASFGKIIKEEILNYPEYGFINVHGSILPRLRGAIPIQMSIFEEEEASGVTIIKMDKGMDTGDILAKERIVLSSEDTFVSLSLKIANVGTDLIVRNIDSYIKGSLILEKQDEENASYCYIKDMAQIVNYGKEPIEEISGKKLFGSFKALYSYEYPRMILNGIEVLLVEIKYHRVGDSIIDYDTTDLKLGSIFILKNISKESLFLNTKDSLIEILKLKIKGKNLINGVDFYNGYIKK